MIRLAAASTNLFQPDDVPRPGLEAGEPRPEGILEGKNSPGEHILGAQVLPGRTVAVQSEVSGKSAEAGSQGGGARRREGRQDVRTTAAAFYRDGFQAGPRGGILGSLGLSFTPRNLP